MNIVRKKWESKKICKLLLLDLINCPNAEASILNTLYIYNLYIYSNLREIFQGFRSYFIYLLHCIIIFIEKKYFILCSYISNFFKIWYSYFLNIEIKKNGKQPLVGHIHIFNGKCIAVKFTVWFVSIRCFH